MQGSNEYYCHCPFCHHYRKKLAINLSTGKWQCWKCGAKGGSFTHLFRRLDIPDSMRADIVRIVKDKDNSPSIRRAEKKDRPTLKLPEEFTPLWEPGTSFEYYHAARYLKDRGIHIPQIIRYQIGYCNSGRYSNRIIVPNYSSNGELTYFVARSFGDSNLSYINPPISKNVVGFDNLINWDEEIILVEGVFDAISVGSNAIPLYGKYIGRSLQRKMVEKGVDKVYMMLDPDAHKEVVKQAERLYKEGIEVTWVKLQDKDPGDMSREEIVSALKNSAIEMKFQNIVHAKLSGNL